MFHDTNVYSPLLDAANVDVQPINLLGWWTAVELDPNPQSLQAALTTTLVKRRNPAALGSLAHIIVELVNLSAVVCDYREWVQKMAVALCSCTSHDDDPAGHAVDCAYRHLLDDGSGIPLTAELRWKCTAGHLFLATYEEIAAGASCYHCQNR